MSNDIFDNPFKQIDKKQFREDKKSNSKQIKKPQAESKPIAQNIEDDEELFLYTMGNVRNIKNTDKYAQKEDALAKTKMKSDEEALNSLAALFPEKTQQSKKAQKKALQTEKLNQIAENVPSNRKKDEKQKALTDEHDFYNAMKEVKPLANKVLTPPPPPEEVVIQNDQTPMMHDFEEGKLEFSFASNADHVQCNILGLDILTLGKLQQRHYNPEAHIDLHNLNAYQAFHTLIGFFKNAYYRDMRCILIVTGKGANSFDGRPLLRSKVCDWLVDSPFKHLVLAFCTAKHEDGGAGALYVLLRKRRKNSPEIPWERMPNDYDLWADLDK